MTFLAVRTEFATLLRAVLALALCCAASQAANLLTATPAAIALSCNTLNGPGAAAIVVVRPATTLTNKTIAVTVGNLSGGLIVTPPSPALLNAANQSQGLIYTVNVAAGCGGTTGAVSTGALRFYAGGVADVSVNSKTIVIATASALVTAPVTLTCVRSAGSPVVYTPGPVQNAQVTSAAPGGTPFTIDLSTIPAWLALPPTTTRSAGLRAISIPLSPVGPCGNYLPGSHNSTSIHLRNLPAPDALIAVTLQILNPSQVVATPAAPLLAYTKGSGTPAFVDVALSSASSDIPTFAVDTATLPTWLSVDITSGTVPNTLHFTTTELVEAIAQGSYSATVRVRNSGFGDLALPFRLTVGNPPPTLTVAEGITRNLFWSVGEPMPIPYVTVASSNSPIAYTIVSGGALAPIVGSAFLKGYAYSYATPIPVTFDPAVFLAAQPGDVRAGTLTITWGTPAETTVITINVTLQAATANVLAVAPPSLPTAPQGQTFIVALTGTGFVPGSDPTQTTTVGIVTGDLLAPNANIVATVLNASNILLAITVPTAADPRLPFDTTGPGGTINLGVCNPAGATCTAPTGTVKLIITPNPVIQAVTSAAAYLQAMPPALAVVAPYDMVSLFGAGFCGTACTDGQLLYGILDPVTLRYPVSVSPDAPDAVQRLLTVTFQTHATPPVAIANAPVLFATTSQINLLVPAAVSTYVGKSIDIVVNFGQPPASSAPFPVRVAVADPAAFTIGTNGQGDGAILGPDWSIIGSGNEAAMRSNPADSDTVQIYMTGLGAPDSTATVAGVGAGKWPADCLGTASYLATLNLQTGGSATALDGAVIAGSLLGGNRLPPCLSSAATIPTVTIGGQPAVVTYAGWVTNSVAGLYQVNVRLPGSAAGTFTSAAGIPIAPPLMEAVQLPVLVTARGLASQPGVTIWVAPRLKLTAPSTLEGAAGVPWPATGNLVKASEGTPAYRYAVTQGALPAGLALDPITGAISGTPAPAATGPYAVTVTATDAAASPLTGSVNFTLTIN